MAKIIIRLLFVLLVCSFLKAQDTTPPELKFFSISPVVADIDKNQNKLTFNLIVNDQNLLNIKVRLEMNDPSLTRYAIETTGNDSLITVLYSLDQKPNRENGLLILLL